MKRFVVHLCLCLLVHASAVNAQEPLRLERPPELPQHGVALVRASSVRSAAVVAAAVQVLKTLNDLNRGIEQGKTLKSIEARLDSISSQLGALQTAMDSALALLQQILVVQEAQWETASRASIHSAIRVVNANYKGWKQDLAKKRPGVEDEIADALRNLQGAASEFVDRDGFSHIHTVALAMGYERDLHVLLKRNDGYYDSGFKFYDVYFRNAQKALSQAIARLSAENANARASLSTVEAANGSFCRTRNESWCNGGCHNCLNCIFLPYSGTIETGFTVESREYFHRDGEGLKNCTYAKIACGCGGDGPLRPMSYALASTRSADYLDRPCDRTVWCDVASWNATAAGFQQRLSEQVHTADLIAAVAASEAYAQELIKGSKGTGILTP